MRFSSRRTPGLVRLCLLAAAASFPVPAHAQQPTSSTLTLYGRSLSMSGLEQTRLLEVAHEIRGSNRGAQDRTLAAAEAVANTSDARYLLATFQLEIGRQRRDDALRLRALQLLIPSGMTPADRLPGYLAIRGDIAFRAHDYATASADWGRLVELQPNDPQALINLAQVRNAMNDSAGAADLIRRAIAAQGAGGGTGPATESSFRQRLSITYNAGLHRETADAAQALLAAYPTAQNWRFALAAYRQLSSPREGKEIDMLQLMRAVGALTRADEYRRLAQLLLHAGFAAEARAVLDEGLSRRIEGLATSPTPEIRQEIERTLARAPARPAPPAPDPSSAEARYRLAAAQAAAGRRAEAEAGFRALATGAATDPAQAFYPDLARFWLAWLSSSR